MDIIFTSPWFTGIVSGLAVAVLNYLLTRKKVSAEVEKLKVETEILRKELKESNESIASIGYNLPRSEERILYDGRTTTDIGWDFKGHGGRLYKRNEKGEDVAITPEGHGNLSFEKGIIQVQRTNKEGRYELWLQSYFFDGGTKQFIPMDPIRDGKRRIRITCDVKVTSGEHTIKFVFRGLKSREWMASGERTIGANTWISIEIYFNVSPMEDCQLRIDDQGVTEFPSALLIRNFVLAERI